MRILKYFVISALLFIGLVTGAKADLFAVKGYDVVAYFTQSKPLEGQAAYQAVYEGKTYQFASSEHLALFKMDPAKYIPAYGGYCAYAMSTGQKAPIDPEAWKIVEGKLYLNYSQSVQDLWQADIPGHIRSADTHWQKIQ